MRIGIFGPEHLKVIFRRLGAPEKLLGPRGDIDGGGILQIGTNDLDAHWKTRGGIPYWGDCGREA
jgi:hypothetical protein